MFQICTGYYSTHSDTPDQMKIKHAVCLWFIVLLVKVNPFREFHICLAFFLDSWFPDSTSIHTLQWALKPFSEICECIHCEILRIHCASRSYFSLLKKLTYCESKFSICWSFRSFVVNACLDCGIVVEKLMLCSLIFQYMFSFAKWHMAGSSISFQDSSGWF